MCLELLKDYNMSVLDHPDQANMVLDALGLMSMGSRSYRKDDRKDLVNDVHSLACLGGRLEYYPNGGFIVHRKSESSFVI